MGNQDFFSQTHIYISANCRVQYLGSECWVSSLGVHQTPGVYSPLGNLIIHLKKLGNEKENQRERGPNLQKAGFS